MLDNIYKDMIEDSPIPYLHIKLIQNEIGDYASISVLNYNRAYEKCYIKNNAKNFFEAPKDKKEKEKWDKIFSQAVKNNKYTVEEYSEHLNEYVHIDIYSGEENEFHFRINKVSKQHIKLSSAIKKSPFIAWIKDRDSRYLDVNNKFLQVLNTSYDEVIGKTSFDLCDKDRAEFIKEKDNKVIKENKMYRYEDYFGNSVTGYDYYEVIKWPYMNEDESVILGTIGIGIDVSENVRLRKQLEETEQKFLDIANNIQDIIIIQDKQKAHYVSPAFEKIYGFKPDELYEDITKWYDYFEDVEFKKDFVNFEKNETYISNFRISQKGKEDKWIWARYVPVLDEEGNVVKRIGVMSDITETKNMEKEVDDMKMDFLANLSHELRTPINLILSALQVLYLKMDKLDPETLDYFSKYTNIISQNGRRLLKLVNNLIDTTKLDSGCFDYNPENNDIVAYVEEICMSISPFINLNDLEIIFDTDEEEKIISFDPDNMERIILNLLSNAIKFNKPNGKIEVSISCKENIEISVKDTGTGIPEDKIDKIFGRFEQVKNKFKKEKEGSGIGLSLVKSLVEIHNGRIDVKSIYGEGTEFIVILPDVLTENVRTSTSTSLGYAADLNRIKIEFSDIYI